MRRLGEVSTHLVTFIQVLVISDVLFALESCGPGRTGPVLGLVWIMSVEKLCAAATSI